MKAFISPHSRNDNKYIDLMIACLEEANINVVSRGNLKKEFFQTKIFIFNWIEGLQSNNVTIAYTKKKLMLIILKLMGKKIVWTLHNKQPHDSSNPIQIKIMKFMVKISDKIIIHSKESVEVINSLTSNPEKCDKKILYVPHPNYIGAYPSEEEIEVVDTKKLKFLFVGAVKPYKNVELLIESFREIKTDLQIELLIAGKASSEAYKNSIVELVNDCPNIKLNLKFIPDEELVKVISKNDILILPYDIKSSLNSGTIILAFSNKKTVISPLIGTLKDYKDKSFFYYYDYYNNSDHKEKLKNQIKKVINDYTKDKECLHKKGQIAFENVKEYNSIEKISKELKSGLTR